MNNLPEIIETPEQLKELAALALGSNQIQIDIETTGLHFIFDRILTIQLGFNGSEYLILTEEFPESLISDDDLIEGLAPIFESNKITKIGHNLLFDCSFLTYQLGFDFVNLYDTFLAEIVLMGFRDEPTHKITMGLDAALIRHKIVDLTKEMQTSWIGFDPIRDILTDEMIDYALDDVSYLGELKASQLSKMSDKDKVIVDLEMEVLLSTIKMKCNGIGFNAKKWLELAKVNKTHFEMAEHELNFLAKANVENWNSNKQIKEYFLKYHGIEIDSYANLSSIQANNNCAMLDTFINYQKTSKAVSTYGESWLNMKFGKKKSDPVYPTVINDRVHCDFTQIINTGRFSSSKPNLQQIPRTGNYRECFEAEEGNTFAIADYSGQEIAIAAILSNEENWLDIIKEGGSIHDLTAQTVYGNNFTTEQRQICKNFNFGFIYGGGAKTLSLTINQKLIEAGIEIEVSEKEIKSIIAKMKKKVPKLFRFLQNKGNAASELQEAYTKLGRRRNLKYEFNRYTQGMNHPIQGTGADIIKVAMCMINDELVNYQWDAKLVLQVHDELITEVSLEDSEDWKLRLQEIMEEASYKILGSNLIKAEPFLTKVWTKN